MPTLFPVVAGVLSELVAIEKSFFLISDFFVESRRGAGVLGGLLLKTQVRLFAGEMLADERFNLRQLLLEIELSELLLSFKTKGIPYFS